MEKAKDIADMIYERIGALVYFVTRSIRLTPLYLGLVLIVALVWTAGILTSTFHPDNSGASNPRAPHQIFHQTNGLEQPVQAAEPASPGVENSMETLPDSANNAVSNNSQTSVQADDSGTTVTVNGQSQSVPANQSFQKSYDTQNNSNTTHTDISVDNTSTATGRSVNLHMQSSSHSTNVENNP